MTRRAFNYETSLYAAIGFLSAIVASPDPFTWRTLVGAVLGGAIAVKAKISQGKPDQFEEKPTT